MAGSLSTWACGRCSTQDLEASIPGLVQEHLIEVNGRPKRTGLAPRTRPAQAKPCWNHHAAGQTLIVPSMLTTASKIQRCVCAVVRPLRECHGNMRANASSRTK